MSDKITKLKFDTVKNYKIKITKNIEREIFTNRYFQSSYGITTIQLNQCPACGHTNINMDPWILACVGQRYLYCRPNKRASNVYKQRGGIPDYAVNAQQFIESMYRYQTDDTHHDPIEMAQEIITKEEADKRFG